VFEGLDGTGKSTQLRMLRSVVDEGSVVFAHMPTGFVPFTRRVSCALEVDGEKPSSGLAQQLAHLACHAESMEHLVDAVEAGALVLDRWWWSTFAYGWYGGSVEQSGLSEESFRDLVQTIWHPIAPSLVFVLLEPHQLDSSNTDGVEAGYYTLIQQNPDLAVVVPNDTPARTHDFVIETLSRRGLTDW